MNIEEIPGGALEVDDGVVVAANADAARLLGGSPVGCHLGDLATLGRRAEPPDLDLAGHALDLDQVIDREPDVTPDPADGPRLRWKTEPTTVVDPETSNLVALLRLDVVNPAGLEHPLEPKRTLQFVELVADGPDPEVGHRVVLVRRAGHAVRTRRIIREMSTGTSVIDQRGNRVWGPVGRDLDEDHLQGSAMDRVHPEDVGQLLDVFVQLQNRGSGRADLNLRLRDLLDGQRWVEASVRVANLVSEPEVGGFLVNLEEITSGTDVASIGHTGGSFLSIAEAAPVGILLSGPLGNAVYFNRGARALLPERALAAGTAAWIECADPGCHGDLRRQLAVEGREDEQLTCVASFPQSRGDRRWLLVTSTPRRVDDGRLIGFVTTLQDITAEVEAKRELEAAQRRLVHLATHDALTGLPNRAFLADHLAAADSGAAVAVLFCDLDGFKDVNDRYGHDAGDRVLARVADRLRAGADEALVARLGGDEFVLVLDGDDEGAVRDRATGLARALVESMHEPFRLDGGNGLVDVAVGLSIGVAVGTSATAGGTFERLLRAADDSMYSAKAAGKGQVAIAG